jgi:integrase
MFICKNAGNDQEKNYLEVNLKGEPYKMVFNKFKTSKSAGSQEVTVPDELKRIINIYLKFRADYQEVKKTKEFCIPFLINGKLERLNKINSITRILNKLFSPKKVGSSMLRHVYLTEKYGDQLNELEQDAVNMGTSTNMAQSTYIKNK